MRLVLLLLLLAPSATALMTDPAGDVAIDHCNSAQSPSAGFEAMDLISLSLSQTPMYVRFDVETTGLDREADYDSGNYFIQFWRGDLPYTLRMYQDNAGTGAIMDLIWGDERSIFGPTVLQYPASVQGAHIVADMPKNQLRDDTGKFPVSGDLLEDLVVSAQAHGTGVYACPDQSGPAIVHDLMPDDQQGVDYVIEYGGSATSGDVEYQVLAPFRASNGESTTYAFEQDITNTAETAQTFALNATVPAGWSAFLPEDVVVEAGETTRVTTYVSVPFVHTHGSTTTAQLHATSSTSEASAEIGVHYLETAQPSGHHPLVYLHSLAALGLGSETSAAMGGGDHFLYWNTVEEDPSDHGLPLSARTVDGAFVWHGCLTPALALGLHPDAALTGSFAFDLEAPVDTPGTFQGHIGIVPDGPRPAICHEADSWERDIILELEPIAVQVNGETRVEGLVRATDSTPRPRLGGQDLLLELRFTPDQAPTVGGVLDLLPGGSMQLPLRDYHEPTPEIPDEVRNATTQDAQPADEDAPALGLLWVGVVLIAVRRLK